MSTLIPAVQVLDKGLNLQTAKIIAPPGTVLDSLNYEQVDFQGQKRIDGYVNYDGKPSGIEDNIRLLSTFGEEDGQYTVDNDIVRIDGMVVGQRYGEEYDDSTDTLYYVVVVDNFRALARVSGVLTLSEATFLDDEQVMQRYREYAYYAGDRIGKLPGQVSGLHWFGDRLYAIADLPVIRVSSLDGYAPRPGDSIEVEYYDDYGYHLSAHEIVGVREEGEEYLLMIPTDRVMKWKDSGVDTAYVYPYNTQNSQTFSVSDFTPIIPSDFYKSSFFEALTHQQARDETDEEFPEGGWKFCHHGWLVEFSEGSSAFGDFPSVNQNLQGLGIQGPTTTGNGTGSPTVLTQSVNISGTQAQVSGWKSSSEPGAYTPRPTDIAIEGDGDFIYADAFVSWEGGVITSPSHTDTLVEYTANNTVEVDV